MAELMSFLAAVVEGLAGDNLPRDPVSSTVGSAEALLDTIRRHLCAGSLNVDAGQAPITCLRLDMEAMVSCSLVVVKVEVTYQ